jgi:hypothetical protein
MALVDVAPGPEGFEQRTFECLKCDHMQTQLIACDRLKSDALGWLSGELGRGSATREEQTIPTSTK